MGMVRRGGAYGAGHASAGCGLAGEPTCGTFVGKSRDFRGWVDWEAPWLLGGLGERACRGEELIVGRAGPGDHGLRYLRKNRKRFDGEFYESWILCETMRTERGPQQRGGGLAREAWRGGPAEGLGRPGDASGRAPPRTAAKGSRTRMTEGKRPDWAGSGSTCWTCGGRKAGSWGTLFLALVLWRGLDLQESALIPTWLLRSEPNPCGTTRCGSSGGTSFVFAAPKA